MWVSALWSHPAVGVQWAVVLALALTAAAYDIRTGRIPNRLTFPAWCAGVVVAFAVGGFAGFLDALMTSCLMAAPFVVLFVTAGGGAGDAKLMGALGAWLGAINGVVVLGAVVVSGVLLAAGTALIRGRTRSVSWNLLQIGRVAWMAASGAQRWNDAAADLPSRRDMLTVPYGVAVFAGVVASAGAILIWRGF